MARKAADLARQTEGLKMGLLGRLGRQDHQGRQDPATDHPEATK